MFADRRLAAFWAMLATLSLAAPTLYANPYAVLAFDNGTIQPGGARPFSNGKNFFNIEGSSNNTFASFGVADFNSVNLADPTGTLIVNPPTGLNSITVTLTQANASFTTAGSLNFYVVEDTVTSIQPNDAAVIFDVNDPNGEGLNGQLAPVHFLGTGAFSGTSDPDTSGTQDSFTFPSDPSTPLDDATIAYVLGVLGTMNADGTVGGTLRVVITPADPTVSATYTGEGGDNTMYHGVTIFGPTLTLDVSFN